MINLPITVNNQYTEELINGMLLILKYQPDAVHNLDSSYGTFQFGFSDVDMSKSDKYQLLSWNWYENYDCLEDKNYWAYRY